MSADAAAPPVEAPVEEAPPPAPVDPEVEAATALVARLTGADEADRKAAASDLAASVKSKGIAALTSGDLFGKLKEASQVATPAAKEGTMLAFKELVGAGAAAEPFLYQLLPTLLERYSDKAKPVAAAAEAAGKALVAILNPHSVKHLLPILFAGMDDKRTWQTKNASLFILTELCKTAPKQVGLSLPDIVPVVSGVMNDANDKVKTLATATLTATCQMIGNRDVEPFIPVLISCIARPAEVPECVHKLSATTFVQAVEAPTLSLMVPLLVRGLRERQTAIKRKCAVIIDNMAKLVDNPLDAAVFLPRLLPGLERVADEVADPECRGVAARAVVTLKSIGGAEKDEAKEAAAAASRVVDVPVVTKAFTDSVAKVSPGTAFPAEVVDYVVGLSGSLIVNKNFNEDVWTAAVTPYASLLLSAGDAAKVTETFLELCREESAKKESNYVDDDVGEDLCNCEFSLAYGGKILLNNARLHLKRGKRYGLCGPNGAGKSTLMRAISNGQLDGFPPKDQLRTVYVEHDIDASLSDMPVVEFVFQDQFVQSMVKTEHSAVEEMLTSVGFTQAMQQAPVASLSGGWKMKLALARAMLVKPDIMLLDEPTNHLDVTNVAWLENYLISLKDVTSMLVSHDSGFLDNVCTDIIHYEARKLRRYRGNLSEFVKQKPEAKSYYELGASQFKFVLPEPGFLEGVKTKDKAILKMMKVGFKYPGTERQILSDVTVQCSLASRVACVGANGAGKSTMIKILTGELEPCEGTVWKHPNLRIAYVAQHAFHHVEQHLDKTPNQYIQWRYSIGEDMEGLEKINRQVTEEEQKKMDQKVVHNGQKKVVDALLGRRKLKKSYEYEVQWVGMPSSENTWLPRDVLEDMGFVKMVNEIDIKEAARQGLATRPLTTAVIQKHLEDVGLEAEFSVHSQIRGLSGGQKVKLVIGAAMWLQPHILVLDEPTNYLDRDSLGALAGAIKDYGGGVIMITHHAEFSDALCQETWVVADGRLDAKGAAGWLSHAKVELKQAEEMIDAFGNVVKIKQIKKKLSNKEKKARDKLRKARKERGEEVSESDEDDA